jgi:hypothetical protein
VHYAKINMTIPLASRGRLGKGGTIIESPDLVVQVMPPASKAND